MDDLEPSLRRNVRIDGGTGQASVKDVVWAVTHRDGPAAGKLVASLADKYPEVAARFDRRRIDGKGQDVTVGNFEVLTDVIFLVESCMREPKRTLEKRFDIARALCKLMNADPAPVHQWASDLQDEYRFADKPCPRFLESLAEGFPDTRLLS